MQHVIDHQEKGAIQKGTPFRFKFVLLLYAKPSTLSKITQENLALSFFFSFFSKLTSVCIVELLGSILSRGSYKINFN